ncbi:MAG TPA: hydrogen gas-evolving membrane-bound hydrogenase subunit E [Candidatus Tectomicrobia bacterium]|nr:hydrogen gas-evolving membrane-bound hydrogenase subunit E [Candidatus Tectomicrobia bacterium]
MALVALIILLPWLGAVALPCLRPILGRRTGRWALLPPAASFLITLTFVSAVSRQQSLLYTLPWFPGLGVNLAFWIDGLSVFFALLIAGMGLLITWYSYYYLDPSERLGRYFAYLMLFMGAMLGIVLSANLITLLVFWELTSISSFLLIGFWQTRTESLYGARQALLVTVFGGLALLGGIVLLFQLTGTLELPELAGASGVIRDNALYPVILGLVLVGAGAKSAQFPMHFWLPNAMAAPTPVSAYLHSATMVKAGLFLVCRMLPVLGGTSAWMYAVTAMGLATFLVGGTLALRQYDLKALLAYSTVSQLGAIMALYGSATPESVRAATFHLFNHATFKGALFLLVGIIEHQAGSRDRRELTGLLPRLPVTGTLMVIAALSMAGVPPLNGFLSKELTFEALLTFPAPAGLGWLLPSIAVAGSLLTVTYSLALSVGIFWGRPSKTLTDSLHEPPIGMILAPAVLAALCILHGALPRVLDSAVLTPAVASITGPQPLPPVMLWHGLNLPVLMSLGALVGGVALYLGGGSLLRPKPYRRPSFTLDAAYNRGMEAVDDVGLLLTRFLQSGYLKFSVMITLSFLVLSFAYPFLLKAGAGLGELDLASIEPYEAVLVLLLMIGALAVTCAKHPLSAVLALGLVGFLVSFLFVVLQAPDLALTQLLIETASLILFLLVLRYLPLFRREMLSWWVRCRDVGVSIMVGGLVVLLLLIANSDTLYPSIASYFLEQSLRLGGGRNVVNVIVVDFRGYDTMGEITVLALAAIGVYALIKLKHERRPR